MAKVRVIAALLIVMLALCLPAAAEPQRLAVAVNQSTLLTLPGVERVAVANPDVADVVVASSYEVLVVGKAPGMTTLHVWVGGAAASYQVEVGTNDAQIANDIKAILGYPDIRVSKVGKNVILEGGVNDQYQKLRAERVAGAYGEKVVNLLEIVRPVQVKIEARIIEINRSKTDNLGIKWGNDTSKPGVFQVGQTPMKDWKVTYGGSNSGNVYNNALVDSKPYGKSWGGHGGYWDINAQLDALIQQGLAKVLSQPNIITLSGEKANILVGGEIPIPVSVAAGVVSVEWKQFGIKLEISPEVNSEGLINSKIKAEVSTVDWSSGHKIGLSNNFQIPPINSRKAESSLALASGQTMALGGLIASEVTRAVTKFPVLADIPVLGRLFTSTAFARNETELVILITPTIVNPQDYVPGMTKEMKDFVNEDPLADKTAGKKGDKPAGGKDNGGKN